MQPRERATFDADELAVALSHYDLGVIESITDFPRGSRRSPKVGVVCERGKFLLKRRSVDRAQPDRVRFTHLVQLHLTQVGFPAPKLVPTRHSGIGLLQIRDHIYELFEFIAGQPFNRTPGETQEAGAVLARFHNATDGLATGPGTPAPQGDYHDAPGVRTGLCAIGSTLSSHDSFTGDEASLASLVQFLRAAFDDAAESVNQAGSAAQAKRLIHSDWHPGNLLFRDGSVVAVIDYDTLRISRRIVDVANGVLQFSMIAAGDPATWPENLDEARFHAFLRGYESISPLLDTEKCVICDLMIEALIAECVPPITETGSVGRYAGYRVLEMVRRKVTWMHANKERLIDSSSG